MHSAKFYIRSVLFQKWVENHKVLGLAQCIFWNFTESFWNFTEFFQKFSNINWVSSISTQFNTRSLASLALEKKSASCHPILAQSSQRIQESSQPRAPPETPRLGPFWAPFALRLRSAAPSAGCFWLEWVAARLGLGLGVRVCSAGVRWLCCWRRWLVCCLLLWLLWCGCCLSLVCCLSVDALPLLWFVVVVC